MGYNAIVRSKEGEKSFNQNKERELLLFLWRNKRSKRVEFYIITNVRGRNYKCELVVVVEVPTAFTEY